MIDLEFNHVSKQYLVQAEDGRLRHGADTLRGKLERLRARSEAFWAVRDVSFQIQRGEAFGIIGHNGAGKSTILKLLSSITAPSAGQITINGRLSALIEVGSGFHPELTGRENVYLSGSILGMRRREITAKLESIVEFAGVRQFIDTPVKRYSSGMYVRLGFAIAAHLDPDILLLDEVLAVGDAAFQEKCLRRIKELEAAGTTIVFISHDLEAVERLCQRAILMHKGQVAAEGTPNEVITTYFAADADSTDPIAGPKRPRNRASNREWSDLATAPGDDVVRLRRVRVCDRDGREAGICDIRKPIGLELTYDVLEPGHMLVPNVHLVDQNAVHLFAVQDVATEWRRKARAPGRYASTVWIPGNFLSECKVSVHAGVAEHFPVEQTHVFAQDVVGFEVVDRFEEGSARGDYKGVFSGVLRPVLDWTTDQLRDVEATALQLNAALPR